MVSFSFNRIGGNNDRLGWADYLNIQLEEGSSSTDYKPYKSSELSVSLPNGMQLNKLPNGVKDTIEEVNGVRMLVKRIGDYALQANDILQLDTGSLTDIYLIDIRKPTNAKLYGDLARNNITVEQIMMEGFRSVANYTNNPSGVYELFNRGSDYFAVTLPVGTYATLADAQLSLAGTKIIYELATPILYVDGQAGFHCDGNLEAFPHGTIYFEPITQKESVNPKQIDITYNLTDKAIQIANSNEMTAINKKISGRLKNSANNIESGYLSNAEGELNSAIGNYSHAEGWGNTIEKLAFQGHAEGAHNTVSGSQGHAEGYGNIARGATQHVSGRYNEPNATDLFQVGMGTSDTNRKNAMRVTADGDIISGKGVSLNELNKNFQGTLPASSKIATLKATGWYRVAEYQDSTLNGLIGSSCNSVNISIRRNYWNNNNEYYNMLLMSIYQRSQFVLNGKLINSQVITKIRHTIDGANLKAYIEIYYSADNKNTIRMDLFNTVDVANNKWVAISPAATEETIEGVSVVSMMDLTT